MKKLFFVSIIALLGIFTMNAEKGEKAFGAQFNYATKHSMVGLGLNFQYEFINNFRVEPEFIYYFENEGVDAFNVNLNFNYLIRTSNSFAIYPLAGFSFARVTPKGLDGFNRFGANIGLGAEYTINNHFAFYVEERFQILKDMNQSVTCLGVKYKF
ncbi:MAG: porin family protein [Muribaculaceae bacterium]|nr:porin family protein [Muribaculaceae bacterium]MBR5118115.1 porin family protein [Muribaculaceae bacterium]